jgi:signal transduction histidine kinase/CheY-like chemotaxis protein
MSPARLSFTEQEMSVDQTGKVSAEARLQLLEIAFKRQLFGIHSMIAVGSPFAVWMWFLGLDLTCMLVWFGLYGLGNVWAVWGRRTFVRDKARMSASDALGKWLPVIQQAAVVHGFAVASLALIVAGRVPSSFAYLLHITQAGIVAGNATHQSPQISVFTRFALASWGVCVLITPWTFPDEWLAVMVLSAAYGVALYVHAKSTHRFFVQLVLLEESSKQMAEGYRLAKDEAESALRAKNQFLTTASHDLRQPVHAMGFLIESIAFRNRDATLNPALDDLRHSVRSLNLMFNSLLDLSKIESGAVEANPVPVPLDPLMQEVATLFGEEARARGLDLRVRSTRGGTVVADPLLLRQSLVNLVHNALRYTSRGGVLICARRRDADWRVEVWDTGMGVAGVDKGKIFSPFYRNEYAWRIDSAGHGLGLSVVARCADLMHAGYGFESIEGRGSWFWLRVPAIEQRDVLPAIRPATVNSPQRQLSGTCLVVEDDPQASAAWASLMQAWGVDARCVASGREAIAALDTGFRPQAILCDQRLRAGESGFDVLRALLALIPEASGAMVSGEYDSPELAQAETEGYIVLHKPLDASDLHAVLSLWLGSKRSQVA